MIQESVDGIRMDDIVSISDEQTKVFPIRIKFIQFFFILLVTYNTTSIFVSSLDLNVKKSIINISILLIVLAFFILFSIPSYDLFKFLSISLFYLFILYRKFEVLQNAFYILENNVIKKAEEYYGFKFCRYVANYDDAIRDMTTLIIIVLIPIILIYVFATLRGIMVGLSFILSFIPIIMALALGLVPSEYQLLIFILTSLYFYKARRTLKTVGPNRYNTLIHRVSIRTACILCGGFLFLYFIFRMSIGIDDYKDIDKIPQTKAEIQAFMSDFTLSDVSEKITNTDFTFFKKGGHPGGIDHGQLGSFGDVKHKATKQLLIRLPKIALEEELFLKGFVTSEYKGNRWEPHGKDAKVAYKEFTDSLIDPKFNPIKMPFELLEEKRLSYAYDVYFTKGKMYIENLTSNKKNVYLPYYADYDSVNKLSFMWDLYEFSETNVDEYWLNFYFAVDLGEEDIFEDYLAVNYIDKAKESELQYRRFVYELYTKLPIEGLDRIKEDFYDRNTELNIKSLDDAIDYIRSYLHARTEYSLSPGVLPKGEDFVEYFVYENQVGYCSHYASAATIMLRAMGYPARYVEGYKLNPGVKSDELAKQKVEVRHSITDYTLDVSFVEVYAKDYNAHAWVEVYRDGLGWYPVEFTPSSYRQIISAIEGDQPEEEVTSTPTPTLAPTLTPTNPPPTPTSRPDSYEEDLVEDKKDLKLPVESNQDGDHMGGGDQNNVVKEWIRRIALLASIVALLWFMAYAFKKWILYRYNTLNNNMKAIFLFGEMEKLFNICGKLPKKERSLEDNLAYLKEHCSCVESQSFDNSIETIKKARFGRDTISKGDLWNVSKCYRKLKESLYQESSYIKRIFLRFGLL